MTLAVAQPRSKAEKWPVWQPLRQKKQKGRWSDRELVKVAAMGFGLSAEDERRLVELLKGLK